MTARRVVVCEVQVPFVRGGAEALVRELVRQLRARGHTVDRVALPFKWYPKDEILTHAAAWRLLDLSSSNGQPIDAVIATKFPSYFVRHPAKVTWLIHQYRAAYELCGTAYSDFTHTEIDVGLRDRLITLDREMLGESRQLFTISRLTSARLEKYNGIAAEPLYHPSRLAPRLHPGPSGGYLLSVGRIESIKRVDLAIRAMRHVDPPLRLIVVGEGTQLVIGPDGVLKDCQVTGAGDVTVHGSFFEREKPGITGVRKLVVSAKGAMISSVVQATDGTVFGFEPGCRLRVKISGAR